MCKQIMAFQGLGCSNNNNNNYHVYNTGLSIMYSVILHVNREGESDGTAGRACLQSDPES